MVFPGIVRRAMKLAPTVLQALALVVFIHVIGQVRFKYCMSLIGIINKDNNYIIL